MSSKGSSRNPESCLRQIQNNALISISAAHIKSQNNAKQARQKAGIRSSSAKYYDIASTVLGGSGDVEELFLNSAKNGNCQKLEKLLLQSCDIDLNINCVDRRTGNTALIWASKRGHSKAVELLLRYGADATFCNYESQSALETAFSPSRSIILDWVETAEVNERLLLQAAWQGNISIVRKILQTKMDINVNCQNAEGLTPLMLLCRDVQMFERLSSQLNRLYSPVQVADELMKHGIDTQMTDSKGWTCLHYLSQSLARSAENLVEVLVKGNTELEQCDRHLFTALHLAAQAGNSNIVAALADKGVDVNARAFAGLTPLHITALKDHYATAVTLLKLGADVEAADNQGLTALDMAQSKKMKILLKEKIAAATKGKISVDEVMPLKIPKQAQADVISQTNEKEHDSISGVKGTGDLQQKPALTKLLTNADRCKQAEKKLLLAVGELITVNPVLQRETSKTLVTSKSSVLPQIRRSFSPEHSRTVKQTTPATKSFKSAESQNLQKSLHEILDRTSHSELGSQSKRPKVSETISNPEQSIQSGASVVSSSEKKACTKAHGNRSSPETEYTLLNVKMDSSLERKKSQKFSSPSDSASSFSSNSQSPSPQETVSSNHIKTRSLQQEPNLGTLLEQNTSSNLTSGDSIVHSEGRNFNMKPIRRQRIKSDDSVSSSVESLREGALKDPGIGLRTSIDGCRGLGQDSWLHSIFKSQSWDNLSPRSQRKSGELPPCDVTNIPSSDTGVFQFSSQHRENSQATCTESQSNLENQTVHRLHSDQSLPKSLVKSNFDHKMSKLMGHHSAVKCIKSSKKIILEPYLRMMKNSSNQETIKEDFDPEIEGYSEKVNGEINMTCVSKTPLKKEQNFQGGDQKMKKLLGKTTNITQESVANKCVDKGQVEKELCNEMSCMKDELGLKCVRTERSGLTSSSFINTFCEANVLAEAELAYSPSESPKAGAVFTNYLSASGMVKKTMQAPVIAKDELIARELSAVSELSAYREHNQEYKDKALIGFSNIAQPDLSSMLHTESNKTAELAHNMQSVTESVNVQMQKPHTDRFDPPAEHIPLQENPHVSPDLLIIPEHPTVASQANCDLSFKDKISKLVSLEQNLHDGNIQESATLADQISERHSRNNNAAKSNSKQLALNAHSSAQKISCKSNCVSSAQNFVLNAKNPEQKTFCKPQKNFVKSTAQVKIPIINTPVIVNPFEEFAQPYVNQTYDSIKYSSAQKISCTVTRVLNKNLTKSSAVTRKKQNPVSKIKVSEGKKPSIGIKSKGPKYDKEIKPKSAKKSAKAAKSTKVIRTNHKESTRLLSGIEMNNLCKTLNQEGNDQYVSVCIAKDSKVINDILDVCSVNSDVTSYSDDEYELSEDEPMERSVERKRDPLKVEQNASFISDRCGQLSEENVFKMEGCLEHRSKKSGDLIQEKLGTTSDKDLLSLSANSFLEELQHTLDDITESENVPFNQSTHLHSDAKNHINSSFSCSAEFEKNKPMSDRDMNENEDYIPEVISGIVHSPDVDLSFDSDYEQSSDEERNLTSENSSGDEKRHVTSNMITLNKTGIHFTEINKESQKTVTGETEDLEDIIEEILSSTATSVSTNGKGTKASCLVPHSGFSSLTEGDKSLLLKMSSSQFDSPFYARASFTAKIKPKFDINDSPEFSYVDNDMADYLVSTLQLAELENDLPKSYPLANKNGVFDTKPPLSSQNGSLEKKDIPEICPNTSMPREYQRQDCVFSMTEADSLIKIDNIATNIPLQLGNNLERSQVSGKPPLRNGKFSLRKRVDNSLLQPVSRSASFGLKGKFKEVKTSSDVRLSGSMKKTLADKFLDKQEHENQYKDIDSQVRASGEHTFDSLVQDSGDIIHWKKGNVLGRGAYGTVWCGLTNLGQLIAVKQIELTPQRTASTHLEYKKIQEEVELLKTLEHVNIVSFLGTSLEENVVSIFMQFIPGGSIASVLARFGALEESVFRHYTRQILQGVRYLHDNNVIHRDIKGANVMLMSNGVIKLIDFGCAKKLCIKMSTSHSDLLRSMNGTPYWMAPEVVNESGHGMKSDIWSVGCTVFEMATRKPPWAEMNPMAAIFAIGSSSRPVPTLGSKFSRDARDFVSQCLNRNQESRPGAAELQNHPFISGPGDASHHLKTSR